MAESEHGAEIEAHSGQSIVLKGTLSVAQAQELYREWSLIPARKVPVVWDASGVRRVDTAVMQLLAVFCRTLRAENLSWRWAAAAPVLREAAHLLGLETELGLDAWPSHSP